jgi:hypothetical protein
MHYGIIFVTILAGHVLTAVLLKRLFKKFSISLLVRLRLRDNLRRIEYSCCITVPTVIQTKSPPNESMFSGVVNAEARKP